MDNQRTDQQITNDAHLAADLTARIQQQLHHALHALHTDTDHSDTSTDPTADNDRERLAHLLNRCVADLHETISIVRQHTPWHH